MKTIALSARVDELNELADHVPVSVLACRLLAVVEIYLEANKAPAGTETMTAAFRTLDAPATADERRKDGLRASMELSELQMMPVEPPAGGESFYVAPGVGNGALLSEVATEIAAHNEAMAEESEPAEDPVAEESPTGTSDSTRGQEAEPEKPCKTCGQIKPLSEFPKNPTYKDGHTNKCKDCTKAYVRQKKSKGKVVRLPKAERAPEPEKKPEKPKKRVREQLCGNGQECVAVDDLGHPTKLNSRNTSGICGPCEEDERNRGMSGRFAGHVVRHSSADKARS